MLKHASELEVGDVILGRSPGPLVVRDEPTPAKYRGGGPAWRIKVAGGYPSIVTPGDPEMHIADDPDDAWNEHVKLRSKL